MAFRVILAGLLCALGLAAPAQAQGAWPANCKLVEAAALPFHIVGGELVVDIRVNGTPRQFIVDTGGFASDVSEKVVQELHLPKYPIRNAQIYDSGGSQAQYFTQVASLTIGNEVASKIQLMVSNSGFDGSISPDLLRNFDIEIDFPNRVINLFRPHPCEGKAVYWTDKFSSVPIDVTESGHIRVPITLNGRTVNALLDTGAALTVLAADVAASRFGVKPQDGLHGQLVGTMGTTSDYIDTPFNSLQIGDTVIDKPMIAVSNGKGEAFVDGTSIVLGQRELRKFHIYIAYHERRLYIAEEDSRPSTAVTISTKTLEPADAVAAAARAAPAALTGTFTFLVKTVTQANGQLLLHSEADVRDGADLAVALPLSEALSLSAQIGAPAPTSLIGRRITVEGGARRVRVVVMREGKPTDDGFFQTRIIIPSASQISVSADH